MQTPLCSPSDGGRFSDRVCLTASTLSEGAFLVVLSASRGACAEREPDEFIRPLDHEIGKTILWIGERQALHLARAPAPSCV